MFSFCRLCYMIAVLWLKSVDAYHNLSLCLVLVMPWVQLRFDYDPTSTYRAFLLPFDASEMPIFRRRKGNGGEVWQDRKKGDWRGWRGIVTWAADRGVSKISSSNSVRTKNDLNTARIRNLNRNLFVEPAKERRRSSSRDSVTWKVVDRFTSIEVCSVRISLVDNDEQLDHIMSAVHGSDMQRCVSSVRLGIHVWSLRTAHYQFHDVGSTVLCGPVQCRVPGDKVTSRGESWA